MPSVVLALLAALTNALSTILQRRANLDEPGAFSMALLGRLVLRRAWLLGAAAMIVSFLLQAAALTLGALAVVQPVLALELPLTVVLGAVVLHRRLLRLDWLASTGMAAGLVLMLAALAPSDGDPRSAGSWAAVLATVATVAALAILVAVAVWWARPARAALLGVAAGAGFGLTAALLKLAITAAQDRGIGGLLGSWETYGCALAGLAAVGLVQGALHAGTLVAVQPGLTLTDPLVAIVWGTVVTGEQVRTGPFLALAVVGAALIATGAVRLARAHGRIDADADAVS